LAGSRLEVVMEPRGTYGDALRRLFEGHGMAVYRISPKRVHDSAEVFDGGPSLHDAKAAYQIGRLHLEGASRHWDERTAWAAAGTDRPDQSVEPLSGTGSEQWQPTGSPLGPSLAGVASGA